MSDQYLFIANMPSSRPADYCLGYMEGCVYIDFSDDGNNICLKRISFDGYGCCELGETAIPLAEDESAAFKESIRDGISNHDRLLISVKNAISLNSELIWTEALEEYHLI